MLTNIKTWILISAITLFSCKKSTPTSGPDNTAKNSALIVGKWQIVAQVSDKPFDWANNGQSTTNVYSSFPTCGKGFIMEFLQGGAGEISPYCAIPRAELTWKLTNNGNYLVWTQTNQGPVSDQIVSLTNDSLVTLSQQQPNNTQIFNITTTYLKQ